VHEDQVCFIQVGVAVVPSPTEAVRSLVGLRGTCASPMEEVKECRMHPVSA
jgi:hypothetical protein